MAFTWGQFHGKCPRYISLIRIDKKLIIGDYSRIPRSQWVHDDVIKWRHFPRYWPFVRRIHRSRWIPHTKASNAEFDVFFDPRLNKRLSKHSWGWWFKTPSRPLWRHRNVIGWSPKHATKGTKLHTNGTANIVPYYSNWLHEATEKRISNYSHNLLWNVITQPCLTSAAV